MDSVKFDSVLDIYEENYTVFIEKKCYKIVVTANSAGLKTLANFCLELAFDERLYTHRHLDDFNFSEVGSVELILDKIPNKHGEKDGEICIISGGKECEIEMPKYGSCGTSKIKFDKNEFMRIDSYEKENVVTIHANKNAMILLAKCLVMLAKDGFKNGSSFCLSERNLLADGSVKVFFEKNDV